jgi:hypothetical protein
MKRIALLLVVAVVSAAAGYCFGFRQAWNLGVMADAPVRGSIAIAQLNFLENGQDGNLCTQFESEVDSGLLWWAQLEQFPLHNALNTLSGQSVISEYQRYVRRVAAYRKSHASPFADPKVVAQMLDAARAHDPDFASELEASGKQRTLQAA